MIGEDEVDDIIDKVSFRDEVNGRSEMLRERVSDRFFSNFREISDVQNIFNGRDEGVIGWEMHRHGLWDRRRTRTTREPNEGCIGGVCRVVESRGTGGRC